MTTNQDHLKNLRNVLLAERERLGISVPAAQIGAKDSTDPINTGMSDALEQLVLLAQLHARRSDDNITRGYTEANISLVRQYMKDRGVNMNQVDLFTGTVQALDTQAPGQPKSLFDQQYSMGGTDLTIFRRENEALLRGTASTGAVAAPRPLTALFQQAGSSTTPSPAPATPAAPATPPPQPAAAAQLPTRRVERTYSFDDIQALKGKEVQSEEEKAALQAWDAQWRRLASAKSFNGGTASYDDLWNARKQAREAFENRGTTYRELSTKLTGLTSQNESLLTSLKDRTMTLTVNGETYRKSWNEVQNIVGSWEFNDSDFEKKLRQEANKGLEELIQSQGYNARVTEISGVRQQMGSLFSTLNNNMQQAEQRFNTAFADIRDNKVTFAFNVTDYSAQSTPRVAATNAQ